MYKKNNVGMILLIPLLLVLLVLVAGSYFLVRENSKSGDASNLSNQKVNVDNEGYVQEGLWSDVRIVTEEYPSFNYTDPSTGEVVGEATKLVKEAMSKLNIDIPISVYPWARSYQIALEDKNVFIYSITRTEEREKLFKWIAPVAYSNVRLYAIKGSGISINKLDDIKNYKIATMKEDFTEQNLINKGYKDNILSSPNQAVSVTQLFEGRTDLWIATAENESLKSICDQAGYDANNLEAVFEIDEMRANLYIAASLNTPDEIVEAFRSAMPIVEE